MNTQQTKMYYNKDLKLGSLQPNIIGNDQHFSNEMSALFLKLLNDGAISIEGYNSKKFLSMLYQLDQLARAVDTLIDDKKLFKKLNKNKTSNKVFELFGNKIDIIFESLVNLSVYTDDEQNDFYKVIVDSINANTTGRSQSYEVGTNKFNVDTFGYIYHPIMSIINKAYSSKDSKAIANSLSIYFHIINFCDDLVDLRSDIANNSKTPLTNLAIQNNPNVFTSNDFLHKQILVWESNLQTETTNSNLWEIKKIMSISLFNMNRMIKSHMPERNTRIEYNWDIIPPIFCYY